MASRAEVPHLPNGIGPPIRTSPDRPGDLDIVKAHTRWVEIHPFVNGNGRTARMWANWILVRYGVPAFVL
jgi:hypothetical protein